MERFQYVRVQRSLISKYGLISDLSLCMKVAEGSFHITNAGCDGAIYVNLDNSWLTDVKWNHTLHY